MTVPEEINALAEHLVARRAPAQRLLPTSEAVRAASRTGRDRQATSWLDCRTNSRIALSLPYELFSKLPVPHVAPGQVRVPRSFGLIVTDCASAEVGLIKC